MMQSDLKPQYSIYTVLVGSAASHGDCESYSIKTFLPHGKYFSFPSAVKREISYAAATSVSQKQNLNHRISHNLLYIWVGCIFAPDRQRNRKGYPSWKA